MVFRPDEAAKGRFFFSSRRRHTISDRDWSSDVCSFVSSRRRHTRSDRDWSSDVCSSDLGQAAIPVKSDTRFILILGGGGMKGLAHIGVLQALTERGLLPTQIGRASCRERV